jgi:hypothetical protein
LHFNLYLVLDFLKRAAGGHHFISDEAAWPNPSRYFCFYDKGEAGCRGVADTLPFYMVIRLRP